MVHPETKKRDHMFRSFDKTQKYDTIILEIKRSQNKLVLINEGTNNYTLYVPFGIEVLDLSQYEKELSSYNNIMIFISYGISLQKIILIPQVKHLTFIKYARIQLISPEQYVHPKLNIGTSLTGLKTDLIEIEFIGVFETVIINNSNKFDFIYSNSTIDHIVYEIDELESHLHKDYKESIIVESSNEYVKLSLVNKVHSVSVGQPAVISVVTGCHHVCSDYSVELVATLRTKVTMVPIVHNPDWLIYQIKLI